MALWDMLGLMAHRGGLVAVDPTLTIGVVQIVARTSGLQVEVIARRPLGRGAEERRETIRAMVAAAVPAVRQLLPDHDEGTDLRLGWLDSSGCPHWEYPFHSSGDSGDAADGQFGPSTQSTYLLPPQYETSTLVFAWPGIGFPETTVTVPLPDQLSVGKATVSVWEAPPPASNAPTWVTSTAVSALPRRVCDEAGMILASPQVLLRDDDAALILTRLSTHQDVLRATLTGLLARRGTADAVRAQAFPDRPPSGKALDVASRISTPMLGLISGHTLFLGQISARETSAGPGMYETTSTWTLPNPGLAGAARLGVAWRVAGLDDTEITINLDVPH